MATQRSAAGIVALVLAAILAFYVMYLTFGSLFSRRDYLPALDYTKFKRATDAISDPDQRVEWKKALKENKIVNVRGLNHFSGLVKKYWVELEGGYLAVGSLVTPETYVASEFITVSHQDALLPEYVYPRRANQKYQGWAEVGANAVAEQIFPGMKLPSVLREIPSTWIWQCPEYTDWKDTLKPFLFGKANTILALRPYIDDIRPWSPTESYRKFLTNPRLKLDLDPDATLHMALDISDILIFDFLVDDHDRYKSRNWIVNREGKLLFWDSGLAWHHGPAGRYSCVDLLCGPEKWKKKSSAHPEEPFSCTPVCRFRRSSIERMQDLFQSPGGVGEIVKESLAGSPVFHFAYYYPISKAYPKLQYQESDYYESLDHKVAKLLHHVANCVEEYGESSVLL